MLFWLNGNDKPKLPVQLPPDIQLIILEYADWTEHVRLAKVCKLWRRFIQTSRLCRRLRFNHHLVTYPFLNNRHRAPVFHRLLNCLKGFCKITPAGKWEVCMLKQRSIYGCTRSNVQTTVIVPLGDIGNGCFGNDNVIEWEPVNSGAAAYRGDGFIEIKGRLSLGPVMFTRNFRGSEFTVSTFANLLTEWVNGLKLRCWCEKKPCGYCNSTELLVHIYYIPRDDEECIGVGMDLIIGKIGNPPRRNHAIMDEPKRSETTLIDF